MTVLELLIRNSLVKTGNGAAKLSLQHHLLLRGIPYILRICERLLLGKNAPVALHCNMLDFIPTSGISLARSLSNRKYTYQLQLKIPIRLPFVTT